MSALAMTGGSYRAEWLKLARRPASWILGIVLLAGVFTLGYLLLFLVIQLIERTAPTPQNPNPGASAAALRDSLVPARFVGQTLSLLSTLGGPVGLILGALAFGSEYGWGTLKTILTQRPGRLSVYAGKVVALAVLLAVFAAGALVMGFVGSLLYAATAGASFALPGATTILGGFAASWLILAAWTALGALLATLFRGTALAIGLGLIYGLVVESVVGGVATLIERLQGFRDALLGANTGALAAAFNTPAPGQPAERIGTGQATAVVIAYTGVFLVLAALLLRRRDVV